MINYYESLGVEASASAEEIKSAYRTLVKRFHPDIPGGDPVRFARVTEAYEVLSGPARRKAFDEALRMRELRREAQAQAAMYARPQTGPSAGPASGAGAGPAPWPFGPGPGAAGTPREGPGEGPKDDSAAGGAPVTRLMSVAMPPGGRFLLEGLTGEFKILPTRAEEIWETTQQKFAGEDAAALAQRVVQIRLHGPREFVRQLRPMPAAFGIQLQGMDKEQFLGGRADGEPSAATLLNPRRGQMEEWLGSAVQLTATVPAGVPVYLYDLSGKITVGDLYAELVATLDERTFLRAGTITGANITLNGRSRAHLTRLNGAADAILFGQSKLLVEGQITRLRAVLEHESHLEATGEVGWLQATVAGRAYLNAKATVDRAHCEVRAGAYVRLAKVKTAVQGTRSGAAGFDVIEGPPPQPAMPRPRSASRKVPRSGLI